MDEKLGRVVELNRQQSLQHIIELKAQISEMKRELRGLVKDVRLLMGVVDGDVQLDKNAPRYYHARASKG